MLCSIKVFSFVKLNRIQRNGGKMKKFMDQDFLLQTPTAVHLFHDYADKMPIVDYHCHLSPKEIAEDRRYENITRMWLEGDHYKWRMMRANGVEEKYITGDASDRDKFQKWAETLEKAPGNPLYHWSHLELQRYFGYQGILKGDTAEEVWNLSLRKIREEKISARYLILKSNVTHICTTDDPADTLKWHAKIAKEGLPFKVLPAFRPDRAMNIEKEDYPEYIRKLGESAGTEIKDLASFEGALAERLDYFKDRGACVSDHGLETVIYEPVLYEEADGILKKRLAGEELTRKEERQFKTFFLLFMAGEYKKRDFVMQLHYGCRRNNNKAMFEMLGPDTGYDCIGDESPASELIGLLDAMNTAGTLPKTVLYSLNPNDNQMLDSVIGCFQDASSGGRVQHGTAWWFNDHKKGMEDLMVSLGNLGLLGNFLGMLTDSRSFLSYARHEYFRRILCNLIGGWVEDGEYPDDEEALKKLIEDICYNNTVRYFGFEK